MPGTVNCVYNAAAFVIGDTLPVPHRHCACITPWRCCSAGINTAQRRAFTKRGTMQHAVFEMVSLVIMRSEVITHINNPCVVATQKLHTASTLGASDVNATMPCGQSRDNM